MRESEGCGYGKSIRGLGLGGIRVGVRGYGWLVVTG